MKVIKLDYRYKMYKERRFTCGLRFDSYSNEVTKYEKFLTQKYGSSYMGNATWNFSFGKSKAGNPRPVFITLKDDHMLTMLLLSV
jgi:hypothetical protein